MIHVGQRAGNEHGGLMFTSEFDLTSCDLPPLRPYTTISYIDGNPLFLPVHARLVEQILLTPKSLFPVLRSDFSWAFPV